MGKPHKAKTFVLGDLRAAWLSAAIAISGKQLVWHEVEIEFEAWYRRAFPDNQ